MRLQPQSICCKICEPGGTAPNPRGGERELLVFGQPRINPGGRVTEAFADIAPPCGRPGVSIAGAEFLFTPFRAPSQFPRDASLKLMRKNAFPLAPDLI